MPCEPWGRRLPPGVPSQLARSQPPSLFRPRVLGPFSRQLSLWYGVGSGQMLKEPPNRSPPVLAPAALSRPPWDPLSPCVVLPALCPPGPPSLTSTATPALLPSCSSVDAELTSLCQSVLEDFNLCLFYLPSSPNLSLASEDGEENESGCAFLPDLLIFQMVVICLMGVHSLKRAGASAWVPPLPADFQDPRRSSLQLPLCKLPPASCPCHHRVTCVTAGLGEGRGWGLAGQELLVSGRRQPRIPSPAHPSHEHTAEARTRVDRVRCANLPGRGERGAGLGSREDTGRAGCEGTGVSGGALCRQQSQGG